MEAYFQINKNFDLKKICKLHNNGEELHNNITETVIK